MSEDRFAICEWFLTPFRVFQCQPIWPGFCRAILLSVYIDAPGSSLIDPTASLARSRQSPLKKGRYANTIDNA